MLDFTRRLIALRRRHPILQQRRFFVGDFIWESQAKDLAWLRPDGQEMTPHDWQKPWISSLAFALGGDAIPMIDEKGQRLVDDGLLVLMNPHHEPIAVQAAGRRGGRRLAARDRHRRARQAARHALRGRVRRCAARALVVLRQPLDPDGRARGGGRAGPGHQEGRRSGGGVGPGS